MSVNQVVVTIMGIFAVAGAVDRIIGNKFRIGAEFERAFMTMGSLALSMVGILVMVPIISDVLSPVIVPAFQAIGVDPSVFAGLFLATDMGGASLAQKMCSDPAIGNFSGYLLSAMMGVTIIFHIPVSFEMAPNDRHSVSTGILIGIITIPIGCIAGGLVEGLSLLTIVHNLVPMFIVAVLIMLGFWKVPEGMIKGFMVFGKIIMWLGTAGLALGIMDVSIGFKPLKDIASIGDAFATVANIVIVLAGAFPLMNIITRLMKKPLGRFGKRLGINSYSTNGLIITLANNIPMFESIPKMDQRGKIMNTAFAVSASFVFGDFLGYTSATEVSMIVPQICGKLAGAVAALLLAMAFTRNMNSSSDEKQLSDTTKASESKAA